MAAKHGGRRAKLSGKTLHLRVPKQAGYTPKASSVTTSFPYRTGYRARRVTRPLEGTGAGRGYELGRRGFKITGKVKSKTGKKYTFARKAKSGRIQELEVTGDRGIKVGYALGRRPYIIPVTGAAVLAGAATLAGRGGVLMRPKKRHKYEIPFPQQYEYWEREHNGRRMHDEGREEEPYEQLPIRNVSCSGSADERIEKLFQYGQHPGPPLLYGPRTGKVGSRTRGRGSKKRKSKRDVTEEELLYGERAIKKLRKSARGLSPASREAAGKILQSMKGSASIREILESMAFAGSIPAIVILGAILAYSAKRYKRGKQTVSERFRTLPGEMIDTSSRGIMPTPRLKYPDRYINRMLASPGYMTLGDPREIMPKTPLFLANKTGDIKKGFGYRSPKGVYRYVKEGGKYGWKLVIPRAKKAAVRVRVPVTSPIDRKLRFVREYKRLFNRSAKSVNLNKMLDNERNKLKMHEDLLASMEQNDPEREHIKTKTIKLRDKVSYIGSLNDPNLQKSVKLSGPMQHELKRKVLSWRKWKKLPRRHKMGHLYWRTIGRMTSENRVPRVSDATRYNRLERGLEQELERFSSQRQRFKGSWEKSDSVTSEMVRKAIPLKAAAKAGARLIGRRLKIKALRFARKARHAVVGFDQSVMGRSFKHAKPWKGKFVRGGRALQVKGRKAGWGLHSFNRGFEGKPMGQLKTTSSGRTIVSGGGARMKQKFGGAYVAGEKLKKIPVARTAYKAVRWGLRDPIGAGVTASLAYGGYRAIRPKRNKY